MTVKLGASVMCMDFRQLEREIVALEEAGIDAFHFDIMDGTFVPNITMGFEAIHAARNVTNLPLVAHLMIVRPERHIERFVSEGCDFVTIHVESTDHPHRVIQEIREFGAHPGVAVNPATPLCLLDFLIHDVATVLVMAVEPGFVGQRAAPNICDRIQEVRELISARGACVDVGVDGNVSSDNAPDLIRAGASFLVLGTSSIFNQPGQPADALRSFRQRISAG